MLQKEINIHHLPSDQNRALELQIEVEVALNLMSGVKSLISLKVCD